MIPLYHDFTDETVLIFGGGPVGARKARRFAEEAGVVVVSPEFDDRDFGEAELVRARPAPADVGTWVDRFDPALLVAATDDERVNDAVAAAAGERGVLLNRADRSAAVDDHRERATSDRVTDSDESEDSGGVTDSDESEDSGASDRSTPKTAREVVVPATVSDGDVRVAISTGGRSPALAKYLREQIEAEIEGAEEMAALTAELRAELRGSDLDPSTRREAIRAVVRDLEVWKALRTGTSNPRREATRVIRNTTGGDRWTRK